jgi:uncharacterized membrane protein YbhN (UPF0104 family)
MTDTSKKIFKFIVRIAGTTILLVLVLSKIDLSELASSIGSIKFRYILPAWGLALVTLWLRSVKMKLILQRQNCHVESRKVFAAQAVTSLYNLIIPGFISTGVKWYIIRGYTGMGHKVFSGMIYNQLTDVITFLIIGLAAFLVAKPINNPHLLVLCGIALAGLITIALLLPSKACSQKLAALVRLVLKPLPHTIQKKGLAALQQITLLETSPWSFHLKILFFNVLRVALRACIYLFAAEAARIKVGIAPVVCVFVVVFLMGRLPIFVGNLGAREFTIVHTLAIYKVEPSSALLMSMVIFSCVILMAFIGVIYQLCWIVGIGHSPSFQQNRGHKQG